MSSGKPLDRALSTFDGLGDDPSREAVESALATLTEDVRATNGDLGQARLAFVRDVAVDRLKPIKFVRSPTKMVDGAIEDGRPKAEPATDTAVEKYADPEPWHEPVDGDELLGEIVDLIGPYVHVEYYKIDAIAAWVIATYYVIRVYCAAILAVIAPTKEAGKSRLLDLIAPLVRRAHRTSGAGITVATMFRIQDRYCPTILVDEAERLSSVKGAADLIALFNDGWTRGGVVTRCVGDAHDVEFFDAFGFRAIAQIGQPADTILSRSIPIRIQRAPRGARLNRLHRREYAEQAHEVARKIQRWADHNVDAVVAAERDAPRPETLGDRTCDNWAVLFAIGTVAGGEWLDRLLHAAEKIDEAEREPDWSEQIVHDVRAVFQGQGWPEAIKSGELVKELNELEDAPWSDMRKGQGLSTHSLARRLRDFKVKSAQERDSQNRKIRGYWLCDLQPVFDRYPPAETGQVGQVGHSSNDAGSEHAPTGTPSQSEVGQGR